MRSRRTQEFKELFKLLPIAVQNQAFEAYKLFEENPHHPSLHFKRIDTQEPIYSARVGRSYRVVGVWKGDTIRWFWIGSHEEYNHFF